MIKDSREDPNRVLPVEPPVEARAYTVTGPRRVFGSRPGATFERIIPPTQEARLIASGAITPNEAEKPVFTRPECTFEYCPDPDGCQKTCVSPSKPEKAASPDGVEK